MFYVRNFVITLFYKVPHENKCMQNKQQMNIHDDKCDNYEQENDIYMIIKEIDKISSKGKIFCV